MDNGQNMIDADYYVGVLNVVDIEYIFTTPFFLLIVH